VGSGQIRGHRRSHSWPRVVSSYRPPVAIFMATSGQFFMAADRSPILDWFRMNYITVIHRAELNAPLNRTGLSGGFSS